MNDRVFEMRLDCRTSGTGNDISRLDVELFEDRSWKKFDLNVETAGFLVFVYAVFACQHMHLRGGAAEHNLLIESTVGSIRLVTDPDWYLKRIRIDFQSRLRSGTPTEDGIASITERMKGCPVSRNLGPGVDCETTVRFEQA